MLRRCRSLHHVHQSSSSASASASSVADSMWDLLNKKQNTLPQSQKSSSLNNHDEDDSDDQAAVKKFELPKDFLRATTKEYRLKNFGMLRYAAPDTDANNKPLQEIPALFKQSWIDFFVSEVPAGESKPVSREYDLTVPEFPPWLLQSMTTQQIIGAIEEKERGSQELKLIEDSKEMELVIENPAGEIIQSKDSLFKPPEEIESDIDRKERQAKEMMEKAHHALEQIGVLKKMKKSQDAKKREFYLQCILHKQSVADPQAKAWLGKALNVHPGDISSSGIKDFKGDTVQLIRIKNVSPQMVVRGNYWIRKQMLLDKARREQRRLRAASNSNYKGRVDLVELPTSSEEVKDDENSRDDDLVDTDETSEAMMFKDSAEEDIFTNMKRNTRNAVSKQQKFDKNEEDSKTVPFINQHHQHRKNNNNRRNNYHHQQNQPEIGKITFPVPGPYPTPNQAPLMIMSHFSYHNKPLIPGNLEGNHFRIVLRGIPSEITDERLQLAADNLDKYGFPNYFGCQRFSWAGPVEQEPAYALLNGDIANFTFRLLEFTAGDHTIRELLQRPFLYPTTFQEAFRRQVVKGLERARIRPDSLDATEYFLRPPPMGETSHVLFGGEVELDNVRNTGHDTDLIMNILRAMWEALLALEGTNRRLCCQSFCSMLWNMCLSERIRRFGLQKVLPGDLVVPSSIKPLREKVTGTSFGAVNFVNKHGRQVRTQKEAEDASTFDVFHPAFQFHNRVIRGAPEIQEIMYGICEEYNLSWASKGPQRLGVLNDFIESPRPICAKASNLSWHRRADDPSTIEVEFTLGKGSYANVALREFLRTATACPGHEEIVLKPCSFESWNQGKRDPGAMKMTAEDLYPDWIREVGPSDLPDEKAEPVDIFTYDGPWERRDEKQDIMNFAKQVLPRNMERRQKQMKQRAQELFEPALSDHMTERELFLYAGHSVPVGPNAPRRKIAQKVYQNKMKKEKDPKRRRMLSELMRKSDRADEYARASRDKTWTPQR